MGRWVVFVCAAAVGEDSLDKQGRPARIGPGATERVAAAVAVAFGSSHLLQAESTLGIAAVGTEEVYR